MSGKKEFFATQEESGMRLDKFLVGKLTSESRTHIKKIIEDRLVKIDGRLTKVNYKIKTGEKVEIDKILPAAAALTPQKIALEILYEDDDILVINKPAGLLVHPTGKRRCDTLANALVYHFGQLPSLGDESRPGIVHRLDEGTSGIMVIAKTEIALRKISEQFKKRKVKKEYTVLVKGVMQLDEGAVDAPIGRHREKRKKMTVRYENSRTAKTYWKVMERFKNSTLVALKPQTGRTHQIRVHMAHIGHPILGDKEYGIKAPIENQALCATYLGFFHPVKSKFVEFRIDLPQDFKNLIELERAK